MKSFSAILLATVVLAVSAQTVQQPSVTIKWAPVTTMTDGTTIQSDTLVTYNLYGGHTATGPWTGPVSLLSNSTIRYGVSTGSDCYYITSVVGGKESLPSAVQCINVTNTPSTVPSAPTNVTIVQN